MKIAIGWLEDFFLAIPLSFLEVWGRLGFLLGLVFALYAFTSFKREKCKWDAKSLQHMILTFGLVLVTGYIGSTIVLVPGAQTFESLKDLSVFLCILFFGYPALLIIPFAYGLSDIIEGVPPSFILSWIVGYFINPACFWIAYILIGKDPDFRKSRTWGRYLLFILIFMLTEPILWGYICSGKFTSEISYRNITPALIFTTTITWILAPIATLILYPALKKTSVKHEESYNGLPIRFTLAGAFISLVLIVVGATAFLTLRSAEKTANQLAGRLQQEIAENIQSRLESVPTPHQGKALQDLLSALPIAASGRAFIMNHQGEAVASSPGKTNSPTTDPIIKNAIQSFLDTHPNPENLSQAVQYNFYVISPKPLARETWLAQATPFVDAKGGRTNWIFFTALPESYYLAGVLTGNSQSAMVTAFGIFFSLIIAAILAGLLTAPLLRISRASQDIAAGSLDHRVPDSRIEELRILSRSFNHMVERLKNSFGDLQESESRSRESESRLQIAVRAANLGIWDWDIKKDLLVWDEGMYRQYGARKDEFRADYESWASRVHPDDIDRMTNEFKATLEGKNEYDLEFRVCWPNGSVRTIKSFAQILRDKNGIATRMVGVNYDITDRKIIEVELRKSRDEALRAYNAKSEFLANMSHEIRTPLNSILGVSGLLAETTLTPDQKKFVDVLVKSGEHLLLVINDILDLTILETKGLVLKKTPFNLHEIVTSSLDFLSPQARAKGILLTSEIGPDVPAAVNGDPQRLRQVLINLLHNAVKFTRQGEVRLSVRKRPGSPGAIVVSVTDTGIGIPQEKINTIFERFTQGNSTVSKEYGGFGLGLSISKHLVEMMGGKIHVESIEGKGSTFSFTLELEPHAAAIPAPPAPIPFENRPLKILVVDDSEDNLLLVQHYLKKTPYQMISATNGEDGIRLFRQERFDLIFMDIQMPIMDGYTATRTIRKIEAEQKLPRTPIVALTAYVLREEEEKSYEAGCDFHLAKPVNKTSLFETIARMTSQH